MRGSEGVVGSPQLALELKALACERGVFFSPASNAWFRWATMPALPGFAGGVPGLVYRLGWSSNAGLVS